MSGTEIPVTLNKTKQQIGVDGELLFCIPKLFFLNGCIFHEGAKKDGILSICICVDLLWLSLSFKYINSWLFVMLWGKDEEKDIGEGMDLVLVPGKSPLLFILFYLGEFDRFMSIEGYFTYRLFSSSL